MKSRKTILKTIVYAFLITYCSISLFPVLWGFGTSLKDNAEVYRLPPMWVPELRFENYSKVFTDRPFLFYMKNSLIIAVFTTFLSLVLGTTGAYAFTQSKHRASKYVFFGILSSRMIPPIALIVPFIIIYNKIGLHDTLSGMTLAGMFLWIPFVTWIMKNYFDSIPKEIYDAARIDGCTEFTTFWRVVLPLTGPGMIASAILTFTFTWNEYLYALALTRVDARTLPVGLTDFFLDDTILWNQLCAGAIIAIIPPLIFVVLMQRFVVRGILSGALKG